MRRTRLAAALTVLPLALSTLAFDQAGEVCRTVDPSADVTGDEYDLCTIEAFVKTQTTKVGNLSYAPQSPQAVATWSEEAPTTPFSQGGGGGYLGSTVGNATGLAKATYQGTFTGELEAIDLDLYLLYAPEALYRPDDIKIKVEAREVVEGQAADAGWMTIIDKVDQFAISAEYIGGSTNALWRQDFGLTGLRSALKFLGLDGAGAKELRLTIQPHFSDSGNWVYVHDAVEVPTSLTFNPDDLMFEKVTPKLSVG